MEKGKEMTNGAFCLSFPLSEFKQAVLPFQQKDSLNFHLKKMQNHL